MEAKDTVMSEEQIKMAWYSQLGHVAGDKAIAQAQAEISFKAGIKEVVEWIEENLLVAVKDEMSGSQITVTLGKAHESEEWQAKIKEWGTNK